MNREEFSLLVKKNFNRDPDMDKFDLYFEMLITKNKVMNLIGIKDEEVYAKLFYDSLIPFKDFNLAGKKILDVGTGAGFPGLPIKILFPELEVTLMDANKKRCSFLSDVIEALKLEHCLVINQRAEEIAEEQIESYDIVTCRALTELRKLVEITARCV